MKIKTYGILALMVLCVSAISSCEFKSKEELYMERGLDILSNKKMVDFVFIDGVEVEEIGVIRDKKKQVKVLIFKMSDQTELHGLEGYKVALRARIKAGNDQVRTERWDFDPKIIEVNSHKYLRTEIPVKERMINKLSIYLYQKDDPGKQRRGEELIVNKLPTHND